MLCEIKFMKKNKENKNKIFWENVIPAILASASMYVYTLTDSIIIGRGAGMDALASVSLTLPFVLVVTACYMLSTIGGASLTAVSLGQKNNDYAENIFMHSFIINIVIGIFVTLIGTIFCENIALFLKADAEHLFYVKNYIFWWSLFTLGASISTNFLAFARNDNAQKLVVVANITSTIINIILDLFFVFILKMGVTGAAIATGISAILQALMILPHFLSRKGKLFLQGTKIDFSIVKNIIFSGVPISIVIISTPFSMYIINVTVINFIGYQGIKFYAILSNLLSLTTVMFSGVGDGLQPILGKYYGAKDGENVKYYYNFGRVVCLLGAIVIAVFLIIFIKPLSAIFGADEEVINYVSENACKVLWGLMFTSLNVIFSVYLYSTCHTKKAIVFNILRGFVLVGLVFLILPNVFGVKIIWHCIGIYEVITFLISIFMVKEK